jgi:hypothetical protein
MRIDTLPIPICRLDKLATRVDVNKSKSNHQPSSSLVCLQTELSNGGSPGVCNTCQTTCNLPLSTPKIHEGQAIV